MDSPIRARLFLFPPPRPSFLGAPGERRRRTAYTELGLRGHTLGGIRRPFATPSGWQKGGKGFGLGPSFGASATVSEDTMSTQLVDLLWLNSQ